MNLALIAIDLECGLEQLLGAVVEARVPATTTHVIPNKCIRSTIRVWIIAEPDLYASYPAEMTYQTSTKRRCAEI